MNNQLIEEMFANAWPSLQTKLYDGWVLRFADGYTKRANSVSPLYESKMELDEKIDYCERQYSFCNLPTIFKLTKESLPENIDQLLEKRGYERIDETSVRILDLEYYSCEESLDLIIDTQFSDNWVKGFFKCSDISDKAAQLTARKILDNILGPVICVSKQVDEKIVGCGFGAIERDYIGIFDIVVEKNFRGNGYGKEIMNGILSKAQRMGIHTAYLQVVVGNFLAENLYTKLGFSEVYRYWYRKLDNKGVAKCVGGI